jgi:hypothetical protein
LVFIIFSSSFTIIIPIILIFRTPVIAYPLIFYHFFHDLSNLNCAAGWAIFLISTRFRKPTVLFASFIHRLNIFYLKISTIQNSDIFILSNTSWKLLSTANLLFIIAYPFGPSSGLVKTIRSVSKLWDTFFFSNLRKKKILS